MMSQGTTILLTVPKFCIHKVVNMLYFAADSLSLLSGLTGHERVNQVISEVLG